MRNGEPHPEHAHNTHAVASERHPTSLQAKGGGERPITITSTLYSLVMGIYGIEMTEWQEDQGASWDDAVRGSSALQAALKRRMLDEIETHELGTSTTGYCDQSSRRISLGRSIL